MYHFIYRLWQTRRMKTRTVCLPPGEVLPGMTVAAQVCGPQGGVLLAAGTVLDEMALDKLRRRNVEFLSVLVADSRDEDTVIREVAEAAGRVAYIFRGEGSNQRAALRRVVDEYRRKLAE